MTNLLHQSKGSKAYKHCQKYILQHALEH